MSLMKKAFTIPTAFQGEKLQGIYLSNAIKNASEKPSDSNATFLESPNYLLSSLSQQVVDERKIQEVVDKLEHENEALLRGDCQRPPSDEAQIETFQYDAMITQQDGKDTRVRVQIDTGSPDSFVSEDVVRRARLQIIPNEAESLFVSLNGEQIIAKDKVWVQWYAINSALTRVTKCHVMAKLPVDILIGRAHIAEYNMLAINRAKGAFPIKANISKSERAELEKAARESEADDRRRQAQRTMSEDARYKKSPRAPPPIPPKSAALRSSPGIRTPSTGNSDLISLRDPLQPSSEAVRRPSSQLTASSSAPTLASSSESGNGLPVRERQKSTSIIPFLSITSFPPWKK